MAAGHCLGMVQMFIRPAVIATKELAGLFVIQKTERRIDYEKLSLHRLVSMMNSLLVSVFFSGC